MNSKLKAISILLLFLILTSSSKPTEVLTVYFGGDMMLDRYIAKTILKVGTDKYFNELHKLWQDGDAVILNSEGPFTEYTADGINKKYRFKFQPILAKVLSQKGVTHLLLANNHSFDQGSQGLKETLDNLKNNKIKAIGLDSNNKGYFKPVIISKSHNKIAILNYCDLNIDIYSKFWKPLRIYQGNRKLLLESIKNFSKNNNFPLAVVLHWGWEYSLIPFDFNKN